MKTKKERAEKDVLKRTPIYRPDKEALAHGEK